MRKVKCLLSLAFFNTFSRFFSWGSGLIKNPEPVYLKFKRKFLNVNVKEKKNEIY